MNTQSLFQLLKDTVAEWNKDNAPRLGAALAFYTIFSLAPLLLIIVAVIGFFLGEAAARQTILEQLGGLVGPQGATAIQSVMENASRPASGILATIIGVVTLVFGASGVFGELQSALNTIWNVEPKANQGIWATIKARFFSFALVLGTGFLLLVSLVISTTLSAVTTYLGGLLPGADVLWQMLNFLVAFVITTGLFAAIYKLLPDADIAWSDVWIGAVVTALLFSIGRFLLGLYLSNGSTTSVYGAAGSFAVLLLWVYYSAQILFFGAEFTQVYANRYGSHIVPTTASTPDGQAPAAEQAPAAAAPEPAPEEAKPRKQAGVLAGFLAGLLVGRRRRS